MKSQAWGWLTAAVLAAGLNSSYHNGGMQWAHEIVDQVGHNTGAVLALATGRADRFLAEARMLKPDDAVSDVASEEPQCPLATAMAEVQNSFDQSQSDFEQFQVMSDRQQEKLARIQANRLRIENAVRARLARVRIPSASFSPAVVALPSIDCPRVRLNLRRMPRISIPAAPAVHIEYSGNGPV